MRRILLELLDALGVAHTRGFVHRDLKPENVFLIAPAQQVKLLDFGIAKVLDAGIARVKTHSGATLGTPAYMAPEQFHDPSGVDPRADLWAVGVMAYEMLAGRLPFRADNAQAMLLAVATQEPDPITAYVRNAPPAIEAFFRRALSRDKAGRFASAAEMAQALAALPLASQVSPQPPAARAPQRPHTPSSAPLPTGPAGQGVTMATGAGTFATPPPATSPTGPVAALAQSAVVHGPPPPHGTSKRAWVVGLGLASLASIAIVIFAVAMTRGSKSSTTDAAVAIGSGSGSGSAVTVAPIPPDAATVVVNEPPVDASEGMPVDPTEAARRVGFLGPSTKPTPDAGVKPTRPSPTAADPDEDPDDEDETPPVMSAKDACSRGCAIAISRCGNVTASCVKDCLANEALQKCVTQKFDSCNAMAICGLRAICGQTVLRGTGTCEQTATCQIEKCRAGDFACGCACARTMSASHAQALSALGACAMNCRYDFTCIANNCKRQAEACVPGGA
jgi:serine/threonine-protein kinase